VSKELTGGRDKLVELRTAEQTLLSSSSGGYPLSRTLGDHVAAEENVKKEENWMGQNDEKWSDGDKRFHVPQLSFP
jgi:hypothetical protein